MRHGHGNPIFVKLRAKSPSLWALFVNLVFALLGLSFVYFILFTCLFLFSILHFSVGFNIPYPTHLGRLVLLQKRIVRIISKKGFDAHTNPLTESYDP